MAEAYIPTAQERQSTLGQGDFLKLSGDGIFATLQGEGQTAGAPSVFVRLHGCNLKCGFADQGWRCDAWYTWDRTTQEFWTEATNTLVEDVADEVQRKWHDTFPDDTNSRLVITGGEPLIQQGKIIELINKLPAWNVEIETNGTILPRDELKRCQINCSPKLSTSGNALNRRYRPKTLQRIASFPEHWFKFVITGKDDIAEVQQIVSENDLDYDRIILMSEGSEASKLQESDEWLKGAANSLGCLTTARNHIFWFGDKRAT